MTEIREEFYLIIDGEDAWKKISSEQADSLRKIMCAEPMPYFTEFRGNMYKTRNLQIRKIKQEYL